MASTRRLAAILAADVVGYSRLMGIDEAGTAQALREHRATADPLISEHGGRVVKTMGDGILIELSLAFRPPSSAQGLDKGQRPGTRSTVRSTARRGWIAHFHPLVFQKRRKSQLQ